MPAKQEGKQLADLEKQVDGLIDQIDQVLNLNKDAKAKDDNPPEDKVAKKEDESDEDVEKRVSDAAELLGLEKDDLIGLLTKAKKTPVDDMEPDADDEMPAKAKKAAAAEESEIVEIEGQKINKADVGEAVFNVLKVQSEKIEKQRQDIQKAKDEAELERLRKRADDMYSHVPGSTEERASMLKAVSAMPKELQKTFEKVLMQSEKLAKSAFETVGSRGGLDPAAMQKSKVDFEKKVAEIASRDKISKSEAMQKARIEDPDAFQAYQGNGN